MMSPSAPEKPCQPSQEVSDIDIGYAWRILSRLGYPARYCGKAVDSSFEFVIIDPVSGQYLATGKGPTLEHSICDAVRTARNAASEKNKRSSVQEVRQSLPVKNPKGEQHEMPIL